MIFTRPYGLGSAARFAMAFAVCCSLSLAFAQPLKPIKILVGFPPGGGTDAAARILAEKLKDELGVSVIVENKPGAGGQIAADYGYWVEVVWALFKASLTILVCGVAAIGFFFTHVSRLQQALAVLSGALFIIPGTWTDPAAIAIALGLLVWNLMQARREAA